MDNAELLGTKAVWGKVGYEGEMYVPAAGTYPGVDGVAMNYTTVDDSGDYPMTGDGSPIANLRPLVMAALYEVGFAWEAGPLSTWGN